MNRVTWFEHPLHWHFVPRRFMPQIDEADETALTEWLAWKGVQVEPVTLDPDALHFAQHVDFDRVRSMPADCYAKPIWVSSDGWVLDGNHRATAHKLKGQPVDALRIDLPFERAVAALFSFAGAYDYAQHQAHAAC